MFGDRPLERMMGKASPDRIELGAERRWLMVEGVGFEPTESLRPRQFSRLVP